MAATPSTTGSTNPAPEPQSASLSALLLLADGRFPAGGHAHSGGLEPAVAREGLNDIPELEDFLRGRVATAGAVAAAFAAAASATFSASMITQEGDARAARMMELDNEFEARVPSLALRTTSRRLGRQFMRAGRGIWQDLRLNDLASMMPTGPHQPVALGAIAASAGLDPASAAIAAAYEAVAGPATAAVRLLGLDPFQVNAMLVGLGPEIDAIAAMGASYARSPPAGLPSWSSPMLDILAEYHATWEVRLFAS